MRLYTFTNYYLSSIQQGIQPLHVTSELFVKYPNEQHDINSPDYLVWEWAKNHKTVVCLNGGNNADLHDSLALISTFAKDLGLPWAYFREDAESLAGAMTSLGVIVPAKLYEYAAELRKLNIRNYDEFTGTEYDFAMFLNQFGLAK
jgi:hypothetical protein